MKASLPILAALIMLAATDARADSDAQAESDNLKTAIFAGGCFWCVEHDFDQVPGVVETLSGYTGGRTEDPTYKEVAGETTGHHEAVRITYDPERVSYEDLLTVFWHSVDPTDAGGQFCDRGESYETAIFVENDDQRRAAEASKRAAEEELGQDIVTPIEDAHTFYPAEEYHQNYYEKNSWSYSIYRWNCARDDTVKHLWGESAYTGIPGHD